jgi:transposase
VPETSLSKAQLLAMIAERDERIKLLEQKIDLLIKRLFGAKSERIDPAQLLLLLQGNDEPGKSGEPMSAAQTPWCSKEELTLPNKPDRPGNRRSSRDSRLPEHLPLIEEVIVPEVVQLQPQQWRQIGEETSERLDYEPARFLRLRTVRPKYVRRNDPDAVPITAPLPPALLERSIVGPGLLAQVIVGKYCDHLPLYRQESIYWSRHKVWLSRQNLSDWVDLAAQWLKPVCEEIRKDVLLGGYVQIDETPVRYLAPGTGKSQQGYLWACAKPKGDVIFHWKTTRAARCLESILPADFNGIVQCDGYEAYDSMARSRQGKVTLSSCMAHIRRKIFEAREQSPRIAGWLLLQIKNLYTIESRLRANRAGPRLRQAIRWCQSRIIFHRLHRALVRLSKSRRFLPQSAMGKAISYALGQWPGLTAWLEDGRVELDNNRVENSIRPTAIGKKNWLFIGGAEAGERSAILYTIIEACRRQGIDPFAYLRDVFTRLPSMTTGQIASITPANWAKARTPAKVIAA